MNLEKYEDLLTEPSNQRKNVANSEGSEQQQIQDIADELSTGNENTYRERNFQLELRLAEQTGQYNHEAGKLHEEISKLQSSFEKQELLRQKLEYQLTLSQQEISKEKRTAIEKEEASNKHVGKLRNEIQQLNSKLESTNQFIGEYKRSTITDLTKATETHRILEAANIELKTENEVLYEEKVAAENLVITWKRKCEEIHEKCELFEKQRNDHAHTIRKLMKDTEFASVKEEELINNMQTLQNKIKSLEENVEAERAAHLETKFSTEVLQLKLRDTENLLEMEKARLQECRNSLQDMDTKYRELEGIYRKDKENNAQFKLQYEKCQKELTTQREQVHEKNRHLDGISNEVKNYGRHLKEIMTELEETKEKLSLLESSKETVTKELKFLLNNYKVVAEIAMSPVKKDGWKFSDATEQIRRILEGYQNKLSQLESKGREAVETIVKLTDECTTHRETAWTRDRALEEAERLVRSAQDGLSQCQVKCAAYEEKIARLKDENEQMKHLLVGRDEKISALNQEVYRNNLDLDQYFQNTMGILQVIYDLLMMEESTESARTPRNQPTMKELKEVILNRIKDDHQNQRVMKEKIEMLKEELEKTQMDLQQHKSGLKKLQKLNSQVLSQTEKSLIEGQQLRDNEKAKYEEEMSFLKSKTNEAEKKLNSFLRKCNGVSLDDLPALVDKINQLEQYKLSSTVLVNMLTSSLWGLLFQNHTYASQKTVLLQTVNNLSVVRNGVLEVTRTLQDSMSGSSSDFKKDFPKSGIFRFRQVVLVVLAANRLSRIARNNCCLKLYRKPNYGHNGLLFYKGDGNNRKDDRGRSMQQWLTTPTDERIYQELQPILQESSENILSKLSTCHGSLLQRTSRDFKSSSVLSLKEDSSKRSLLHVLGDGLKVILQSNKYNNHQWATSSNIVEVLRKHILDFTVNLHEGEELKKSLKTDRDRYRESRNKYRHEVEMERSEVATLKMQEHELNAQIEELKNTLDEMVYKEQMDEVCADLKNALKREEELQMLFEQQMVQIKDMENRIIRHEECSESKNNEFAELMKTLKSAQADGLRRDETIRELQNRVSVLKHERSRLQKCIEGQEEKLGQFICDREILARYMRRTTSVIHNSKKEMHQSVEAINMALKELLPQDSFIVGTGKDNPEMQLVQNTVRVFFDAQREALMRISVLLSENHKVEKEKNTLQDELSAHQLHIRSLKDRVSQLFTQDMSVQKNVLVTGSASMPVTSQEIMFIPLQEH